MNSVNFLEEFTSNRKDYYRSLNDSHHEKGWLNRADNILEKAIGMLNETNIKDLVKEAIHEEGFQTSNKNSVGKTVKEKVSQNWRPLSVLGAAGTLGLDHILDERILSLTPWQMGILGAVVIVYMICRSWEKIAGVTK